MTTGTLGVVRRAVRSVVDRIGALETDPELRNRIAKKMVHVSMAAAELLEDDRKVTGELRARRLARGQAAGGQAPNAAVQQAPKSIQALKDAIDFPTFVTQLITGVFTAITTSTLQQLEAFADLLDGISGATPALGANSTPPDTAVRWLRSHFDVFDVQTPQGQPPVVTLRQDAELPDPEVLKSVLDATDDEVSAIDDSDLTGTLLPLVRRKIGRNRQAMLSTMVLLGLQRVVVDEGSLHATMELAVDARSTAEQTTLDQSHADVTTTASASFGVGMWGGSASVSANVGYVKSDQQYSREDIAARAGLRSSVDVTFRTEQIPLDRMANEQALARIRNNSRVPEAEWHPQNLLTAETRNTQANPSLPAAPGAAPAPRPAAPAAGAHPPPAAGAHPPPAATPPAAHPAPANPAPANAAPANPAPANPAPANPPAAQALHAQCSHTPAGGP